MPILIVWPFVITQAVLLAAFERDNGGTSPLTVAIVAGIFTIVNGVITVALTALLARIFGGEKNASHDTE